MPTYSHWRLVTAVSAASSPVRIAELAYLSGVGGDLTTGGTSSASSASVGFAAASAFDKDTATEWEATPGADLAPWLQYQHAAPVDVAQVSIRFAASASYLPAAFWFQASNTGAAPWDLFYPAGGPIAAATTRVYDLIATRTGTIADLLTPQVFTPEPVPPWAFYEHKLQYSGDRIHGGAGCIYGNVFQKGEPANIPLVRRVRLLREVDSLCLRETWSNAAGNYEFPDLSLDYKYTAIAYDRTHDYRAVIADNLTPEVPA